MDYSKFLDDNFDAKEWINNAFKTQKDSTTSKDQYATTLVMKLQMFIQEVNNVIEEGSQQALQNMPRVLREIDAVTSEAKLLQDQMRAVKEDIEKVEHDTAQSMETLMKLDQVKSRMKDTSHALQEADNWTTLSANVEEVFQSQDISAISQKLVGMQQSLQMLVDVPDYEDRCNHLESLKNRLEAMLSPQLVAAFNTQSLESAQGYVQVFSDINRLQQLNKYYHKCQKAKLLDIWKKTVDENSDKSMVEWLPGFYDQLLSTWHTQITWCSQVFSNPARLVCDVLTDTLLSVDPSLPLCVTTTVEEESHVLPTLIELKEISGRFAKAIEGATESHISGSNEDKESVDNLLATIYKPYHSHIASYGQLEQDALMADLNNIALDHSEILDTVRLVGESVTKLFSATNQANERCLQLTNGCGYVGLLDALQKYFSAYVMEFRRVLTNLREKCKIDNRSEADDWSFFQHSLRMIQTCGDLILHLDELDGAVISNLLMSAGKYCVPLSPSTIKELDKRGTTNQTPFHKFTSLYLEDPSQQLALEHLITQVEEGDTPSVLPEIKQEFYKLSELVHKLAFDIAFAPLKHDLVGLSTMEIWTSQSAGGAVTSDLPTFSLSPQEYITKIGQYLMTLPQQLEPFTMQDNPALIVALKHGKLPFTDIQEVPEHIADVWLDSISKGTMHTYSEEILKVNTITAHATRQMITDIDYLCNVLDDLGLHPTENLKNIETLLKAPQDDFNELTEKMPVRLYRMIAGMRDLSID
ncbi:unnamed protein product [Owenia fusiformis]|uniref:Conserved oligomeric Golgi complex subunit 7 n=1 Tax=Owenia fusiformis TaxID=6347 RepID=A0A8J1Y7R4_OWEFU|nr:unnamed protein product [Owenia fusiformis]